MRGKRAEEDDEFELDSGCCGADPITKQGRRIQRIQMMMLPLIPAAVLLFQCFFGLVTTVGQKSYVMRFEEELLYDEAVAILSNQLHSEWRRVTWFFLTENNDNRTESENHMLEESFNATMDAIHELEVKIETNQYLVISEEIIKEDQLIKETLRNFHQHIRNGSVESEDARHVYEDVLFRLQNEVFALTREDEGEDPHWQKLVALETLLKVRNNLGIEHYLGQKYYYGKTFNIRDYNNFVGEIYVTDEGIKLAQDHYSRIETLYKTMYVYRFELYDAIQRMVQQILRFEMSDERRRDLIMAVRWKENVTTYAQILEDIEHLVIEDIKRDLHEEKQKTAAEISVGIVVVVCLGIGVPMILAFVYRTSQVIQKQITELTSTDRELRKEKKKSDTVLYQMLPKSVALQLKKNQRVMPEVYNSATIYFSDIVGFTSLSAKSSPMQVVDFLNDLYYMFDSTIDRHDVYKVETIGDAYMIASGLPQRNGKNHAGHIGTMALELVKCMETFVMPHLPAEQIRMRVGLHSGPVVAGVVGTKMPRYCLFGETVDIASLMESSGVEMKIQISQDCKTILEEVGGFTIEPRGTLIIKGREMDTYFLLEKVGSFGGSRTHTRLGISSRMQEIPLLNFTCIDSGQEE